MRLLKIHSGTNVNFENEYDNLGQLIGYKTIIDGDVVLSEKYPVGMSDNARSKLYWSSCVNGELFRTFIYQDENGEKNPMGAVKRADGHECTSDYDLHGNLVSYFDTMGNILLREYDEFNRLTYIDDQEGDVQWFEYTDDESTVPSNVTTRNKTNDIFKFDNNANCIYIKLANGYEIFRTFDDQGNVLSYRNSDGIEFFNEYIDI